MALRIRYEIFEINKIRLYIERVVWDKKGLLKIISSLFGHISASQTLFSHRKLIYKIKKKTLWDCWIIDGSKKWYIKQRNHHSIFLTPTKQKRRMVIGSFMDPRIIEPIFCFLSPKGKVKNVNSILEPYATHKKSLYGYSNFSVFLVISPHSAK